MNYHRFTDIWPLLEGDDFEKLKADIKANGIHLPILTYQGEILDGRNRERACEAVGSPARYEKSAAKNDDEALDLVMSLNERRRHLSMEQRAFAAAKLANLKRGRPWNVNTAAAVFTDSQTTTMRQAAKKLGVSFGSAERARAILTHGTDADVAEVLSGKTKLHTKAERLTKGKPRTKTQAKPAAAPRRVVVSAATQRPGVGLTREQVNPDFKGTPTEFVDMYGHVQVTTAIQRSTANLNAWAANMRALAREAQRLPAWPEVQQHWIDTLTAPNPHDIAKLTEAMEYLRPKMAEAELVLERAVAVAKAKENVS